MLFCASFFSKASKFSFLKIFNSIFEDKQKRAATVVLISYQGLCFPFLLPLLINLLFGVLDRVWDPGPHAGRTSKFRRAPRAAEGTGKGKLQGRKEDESSLSGIAPVREGSRGGGRGWPPGRDGGGEKMGRRCACVTEEKLRHCGSTAPCPEPQGCSGPCFVLPSQAGVAQESRGLESPLGAETSGVEGSPRVMLTLLGAV